MARRVPPSPGSPGETARMIPPAPDLPREKPPPRPVPPRPPAGSSKAAEKRHLEVLPLQRHRRPDRLAVDELEVDSLVVLLALSGAVSRERLRATTVELLNRKLPVWIKTYEGTDWTDHRVRVTLYESDEISLFPRVLAQWQVDSGYTLGPRVVKAISERFDDEGTSLSIEQELIETGVPIEVGGRTMTCLVERSRA